MPEPTYTFTRAQLETLFVAKHFPERSVWEDRIILAYLLAHSHEFDRYEFSRRVGRGLEPDPAHLPGVQAQVTYSSKKRIDMLAWSGSRPTIIEAKKRVTPAALGQVLTYRSLLLQEYPDADEPGLVVIAEEGDAEAIGVLQSHGVSVYLYPPADAGGADAGVDRRTVSGQAP